MPLTAICNERYSVPRQRQLFKNIIYDGRLDAEKLGEGADIDDVLEQLPLARIAVALVADRGERHAEDADVVAELRLRQRPGRIVKEKAAGIDLGDVLVPGLRVHGDGEVDAAAAADMAGFGDPHLVPGG